MVNMPVILEKPMTPGIGDPEAPMIGEDEEGLLVPEEIEEEHLEGCFVEFPTCTFSLKKKRSDQGKRIDYRRADVGPYWKRTTLEMTPKDLVESFFINSVRSVNILTRAAQQMIRSWDVERRNMEKYKKSLEEIDRERVAAIDQVKELEKKVSDLEGVNMVLTKIKERLMDECVVKDGELRSLNDSFVLVNKTWTNVKRR
ncbi:hypothetical protein M9H77_32261 [Catharanthus roseus]|uniref:Uncharacterized protein n=1 Tax=Catharanthus roseus TaxID=4058 RepID=A0ACC0A2R5_CATRO|nr:hypothetical protein M9H77_32261 [Catharanthus roseus]